VSYLVRATGERTTRLVRLETLQKFRGELWSKRSHGDRSRDALSQGISGKSIKGFREHVQVLVISDVHNSS